MVGTGSDSGKIDVIFNANTLGLGTLICGLVCIKRAGRYFGSGGGGLTFFFSWS